MTVEYVDLADYLAIAAEVTGLDLEVVMKVADMDLADSALHAPAAGFGADDFYPDFVDKRGRAHRKAGQEPSAARRKQAGRVETADWLRRHLAAAAT